MMNMLDYIIKEIRNRTDCSSEFKHYGVGHLNGGHSGRYPYGSGKRPHQHDSAARAQHLKAKNVSSGRSRSNASLNDIYSDCHDFQFKRNVDPEELARMKQAADIGLSALEKFDGTIGISCEKYSDGTYDGLARDWFLFEDQTIGYGMFADLIAQGYSAKQVKSLLDNYHADGYETAIDFYITENFHNPYTRSFIDYCEKAYQEQVQAGRAKYRPKPTVTEFNGYTADDVQKYFDSIPKGDSEYGLKHKKYSETIYRNMPKDKSGFIEMYKKPLEDKMASIAVSVHPNSRGKGVGTSLLEGAKASMDKLGLERLEYYVKPSNTASVKLAQKAGFEIDKNYSNSYMYAMAYNKKKR